MASWRFAIATQTTRVPLSPAGRPQRPARGGGPVEPWRFARLLAAPHRLGFSVGAAMLSAGALWWLAVLAWRFGPGLSVLWAVGSAHAHALLMIFSFMPMFFAGFLFTAGPRWLALPAMDARVLLPVAVAWLAGWGAFLAGAHTGAPLAAVGLVIVASAWSLFTTRLVQMVRAGRAADRTHLRVIAAACGIGAAALWLAASGIALGESLLVQIALSAGLWWFLAPVFAAASHRMAPFFDAAAPRLDERHPNWLLWTWLAVLAVQPPLAAGLAEHDAATLATAVLDGAAALAVGGLALRWARVQNLRIHLLAMLHVGFVWLGIALALQALAAWLAWSGYGTPEPRLAALHALGMGSFASTQLAFVTRVSAGQDGRAHSVDGPAWALFLGLQAAVALRLAATALPAWQPGWRIGYEALLLAAAAAWAAVMLAWSARYVRWYGRPRSDGRPG